MRKHHEIHIYTDPDSRMLGVTLDGKLQAIGNIHEWTDWDSHPKWGKYIGGLGLANEIKHKLTSGRKDVTATVKWYRARYDEASGDFVDAVEKPMKRTHGLTESYIRALKK